MKIAILTDNPKSWFIPYGHKLKNELEVAGHKVIYIFNKEEIPQGDVCFLLSCSRIIQESYLQKNKNNIVVHASDLPKGKGFSPLQWQVLEGKNNIVLTLFEVIKEVDAGPFYLKETMEFIGNELYSEMRDILGYKIVQMCMCYIRNKHKLKSIKQEGEESYYRKRTEKDDELDPNKTILEQFNHFRIADNDNFPLWFELNGKKYFVKIYTDKLK